MREVMSLPGVTSWGNIAKIAPGYRVASYTIAQELCFNSVKEP